MTNAEKISMNAKKSISELTNQELIEFNTELTSNTFDDDSPVRHFINVYYPQDNDSATFLSCVIGLIIITSNQLAKRVAEKEKESALAKIEDHISELKSLLYNIESYKTKDNKEEFNKAFNDILKGSTLRYLDPETGKVSNITTTRIEVLNKDRLWLVDYDCNIHNYHIWYNFERVYAILCNKFSLKYEEIRSLMNRQVESQYKLKDTQLTQPVYGASAW